LISLDKKKVIARCLTKKILSTLFLKIQISILIKTSKIIYLCILSSKFAIKFPKNPKAARNPLDYIFRKEYL